MINEIVVFAVHLGTEWTTRLYVNFINQMNYFFRWPVFQRMLCYVAISVFNQSRSGQRINSLHVIETDAAYRNPRFRSIPLDNLGLEKEKLFASGCSNNYKTQYINSMIINI